MGATKDVVGVFNIIFAYWAGCSVGLVTMKQETVCRPFPPEGFEEVIVLVIGESNFNRMKIDGAYGRQETFGFGKVGN